MSPGTSRNWMRISALRSFRAESGELGGGGRKRGGGGGGERERERERERNIISQVTTSEAFGDSRIYGLHRKMLRH